LAAEKSIFTGFLDCAAVLDIFFRTSSLDIDSCPPSVPATNGLSLTDLWTYPTQQIVPESAKYSQEIIA
jgi:hypothetical protein